MAEYRLATRRRRKLWLLVVVLAGLGMGFQVIAALAAAVILIVWLVGTGRRDIDRWRRGAMGEWATAVELSRLSARRWRVWHDIRVPGSRANLDHVVIGPTGVWVVDTKTTLAPVRSGWRKVYLGERQLDTSSTRWEAEVVEDRLDIPVAAIVAVHGEGLRRRGVRTGDAVVLPADRLIRRLKRGRRRLSRSEVDLLAAKFSATFEHRA